ncbi:hypothetical protein MATR_21480 [Marivirga tractuosa]|uniref:Helix-turn-helix domain-containing protein n=1 Tax=Marivirga tractuosa (strain ATCC 23168 / DSM 4126 / NBRC 15989 / NCIMB 1408 / VKM B-1430 / H-43) TaxID=643867 RepID=E4TL98_MARTH|nr:helix-turn-helix domain-containing protein [Marivirga tractuosa]ADR20236.1 hypothetical protein Ftrac_0225 [Marivirga tractuosa DSM 4126]BDD15323.1 hypothetical protein MATR_21480 [Marivirga tractuosa]
MLELNFKEDILQKVIENAVKKVIKENGKAPTSEWVCSTEAMEILGIKKTKLADLRTKNKVEYSKVSGKNILYSRASLLKYIEEKVVKY